MNNTKLILIIGLVLLTTMSCQEQLDVKPQSSLTEDQVLKDVSTAQGLLNSSFAILRNGSYYGRDFVVSPELLSDNCTLVNAGDRSGRGQNQAINLSGTHLNIYFIYQTMNTVNLIIDAIDSKKIVLASQADAITINRVKAQALFMRALFHFDLVRTYSYNPNFILNGFDKGVPVVTKPVKSKSEIVLPSRPPIVDVYKQVEADLLASIDLFTATGTPNPVSRFVPNRAAAQALLARVYIYWAGPLNTDKYQLAINMATEAINSGAATLSNSANLVNNWVSASATTANPESFLEANFASTAENLGGDNSLQGWYTRQVNGTGARVTGWGDVIASASLVSSHAASDIRQSTLMEQARRDFEPASSRQTRKYVAPSGAQFGLKNVPILRIAEMFLIRGEAYSFLNNDVNALADLNQVRFGTAGRTGLLLLSGISGEALRTEIFNERRRELAFEGHRWFDFTRRGLDVQKPDGTVISYSDFRILANIPLGEVQANKNLEQNPGY
jgi:starch-binding outer membrane protein, SusD/RagB family